MADWSSFFAKYWYFLLAALGLVILLIVYGAAYVRALRPRTGTLEWISRYDRPTFGIAGKRYPLERSDAGPAVCAGLLAAALWGLAAWRNLGGPLAVPTATWELVVLGILNFFILPAVTAVCAYLLFQGLFGVSYVALLGAIILSLNMTMSPLPAAVTVVSLLLLCRFLTAEAGETFASRSPWLILTAAVLTAGCYFEPGLAVLAAAEAVLLIAGCISRFVQLGRGSLIKSLCLAMVGVAVTTVLLYIPAALVAGMPFPKLLISKAYYLMIVHRAEALFAGQFGNWTALALPTMAYYDWPLLLCGLAAFLAAAAGLFRRRDYRGLLLTLLVFGLTAMWLLGACYAVPVACVACFCYAWSELHRRDRAYLAEIGAAAILLILAAQYVLFWILR